MSIHPRATLEIMVGPSRAGKSTWLKENRISRHIISSDELREDICGDWTDQSKNAEVFEIFHKLAKARLELGLHTILDATHVKRADRIKNVNLAEGIIRVKYLVINRHMSDKIKDAGRIPKFVIEKHEETFRQNFKDICAGDNLPNVDVEMIGQLRTLTGWRPTK